MERAIEMKFKARSLSQMSSTRCSYRAMMVVLHDSKEKCQTRYLSFSDKFEICINIKKKFKIEYPAGWLFCSKGKSSVDLEISLFLHCSHAGYVWNVHLGLLKQYLGISQGPRKYKPISESSRNTWVLLLFTLG